MGQRLIYVSTFFFLLILSFSTNLVAENLTDASLFFFDSQVEEEKFELIKKRILNLKSEQYDKAIAYANEGLELAEQEKNEKWKAEFLFIAADLNADQGLFEKSNQQFHLAISLFQNLKDPVGVAKAWAKLGTNQKVTNDLDLALFYLQKASAIFESIQNHRELYLVVNDIGSIYLAKADYAEALKYYEEAISICETNDLLDEVYYAWGNKAFVLHKTGNPVEAMRIYFDILKQLRGQGETLKTGLTYHHIANLLEETLLLDEAAPYYHKALEAYTKARNNEFLSSVNIGLGELALKQENFEVANYHFEKSLEIKQNMEVKTVGLSLYHLGELHLKREKYKEAVSFFNKSLAGFKEFNDRRGVEMVETMLGVVYLKTNKLEQAEKYLLKARSTEEKAGRIRDVEIVYKHLYEFYQLKGNYQEALAYQQKLQIVKDSLYSIAKLQKINQQLMKEALSEKELLLDSLRLASVKIQDQNSNLENLFPKIRKRQYSIIFISLCVLILLIWWALKIRMKQKDALTKLSQNKKVQQELNEIIDTKNKDINILSVKLIRKNQTLKKLKELLKKQGETPHSKSDLNKLLHNMQADEILHQDWDYFNDMFNKAFPEFFARLSASYSSLSKKDLRLCGLIRSNLSPLEVSEILGISLESVHSARYRLRKKLKLKRKDDLDQFILKF